MKAIFSIVTFFMLSAILPLQAGWLPQSRSTILGGNPAKLKPSAHPGRPNSVFAREDRGGAIAMLFNGKGAAIVSEIQPEKGKMVSFQLRDLSRGPKFQGNPVVRFEFRDKAGRGYDLEFSANNLQLVRSFDKRKNLGGLRRNLRFPIEFGLGVTDKGLLVIVANGKKIYKELKFP